MTENPTYFQKQNTVYGIVVKKIKKLNVFSTVQMAEIKMKDKFYEALKTTITSTFRSYKTNWHKP